MAMGPFFRYSGLHVGSGDKLYMDKTMSAGTITLNDYRDAKGAPQVAVDAAVPIGTTMKSFVPASAVASVAGAAMTRRASGIQVAGSGYISLGAQALITASLTDYLITLWFKATAFGTVSSSNNRLLYATNNGTTVLSLTATTDASGVPTTAQFTSPNASNTVLNAAMLSALHDGALHQFAFHIEPSSDGLNQRVRHFMDGALQQEKAYYTKPTFVAPIGTDITALGRSGYGNIVGTLSRARIDNVASAGATADAIIALDYAKNYARLAA